ncbi:rhodanese-like domain-containing protein [Desulfococcus sp.]|uniref:rhodanese-like domain-containing protein n=1 Tax=Desulfococcus sp. TaxID=2025834 RepID=UPI0035931F5A
MFWVIAFLLVVVGWDAGWVAAGVKPMFPWQLRKHLAESKLDPVLIDVRTPAEYRLFHIAGARLRPDLLLRPGALELEDPLRPVVVICMTGHRSPVAAHRLGKHGIRNVYNLTWGMLGWKLFGGKTLTGDPPAG